MDPLVWSRFPVILFRSLSQGQPISTTERSCLVSTSVSILGKTAGWCHGRTSLQNLTKWHHCPASHSGYRNLYIKLLMSLIHILFKLSRSTAGGNWLPSFSKTFQCLEIIHGSNGANDTTQALPSGLRRVLTQHGGGLILRATWPFHPSCSCMHCRCCSWDPTLNGDEFTSLTFPSSAACHGQ